MTTIWPNGKTIVTRLRVRGSVSDPLSTRLRLASLLNAADWYPVGLAPSVILCIRQFRDPLPGKLSVQDVGARPPIAWEQAVVTALDQLVRHAARPALGAVPANAEAVLFVDHAELLACLASDYCAGSAITRWWWQSLFRGTDISTAVLAAWHEAPEYVPAALQYLAENEKAVPFMRTLNDNEANVLLQSLTQRFALPELQAALALHLNDSSRPLHHETPTPNVETAAKPPDMVVSKFHPPPVAPWQRWVKESQISALGMEQQCLLGIGLMLQRAPAVARTPSFAQQVQEWRQSMVENSATLAAMTMAPSPEDRQANLAAPPEPLAFHDLRFVPPEIKRETENVTDESLTLHALRFTPPEIKHETENVKDEPITSHDLRFMPPEIKRETKNVNDAPVTLHTLRFTPIETAYGGVFYLINLGLFLNLYGDFTAPLQPGIALSIWDFVALLGEQFVGEKIKSDPVWPLLAQLAGRNENEAPGRDFEPPDLWRLPAAWLAPFPEASVWQWTVENERLRVKHPEQFLIIDVPLAHGDPEQQLQNEMQVYSGIVAFELQPALFALSQCHPASGGILFALEQSSWIEKRFLRNDREELIEEKSDRPIAPVRRWLRWLVPYLRARLIRALGLSNADDLPKILCAHHARIFATATHLDIELSLAELPIAIRFAGLDRNPGWVPAAGKFVDFRFLI